MKNKTEALVVPGQIPVWAIRSTPGELAIGAHLVTKSIIFSVDAYIISIEPDMTGFGESLLYTVVDDNGDVLQLTENEVKAFFYPPMWIRDVREVLAPFGNEFHP